jgi:hypothetical protein
MTLNISLESLSASPVRRVSPYRVAKARNGGVRNKRSVPELLEKLWTNACATERADFIRRCGPDAIFAAAAEASNV